MAREGAHLVNFEFLATCLLYHGLPDGWKPAQTLGAWIVELQASLDLVEISGFFVGTASRRI